MVSTRISDFNSFNPRLKDEIITHIQTLFIHECYNQSPKFYALCDSFVYAAMKCNWNKKLSGPAKEFKTPLAASFASRKKWDHACGGSVGPKEVVPKEDFNAWPVEGGIQRTKRRGQEVLEAFFSLDLVLPTREENTLSDELALVRSYTLLSSERTGSWRVLVGSDGILHW